MLHLQVTAATHPIKPQPVHVPGIAANLYACIDTGTDIRRHNLGDLETLKISRCASHINDSVYNTYRCNRWIVNNIVSLSLNFYTCRMRCCLYHIWICVILKMLSSFNTVIMIICVAEKYFCAVNLDWYHNELLILVLFGTSCHMCVHTKYIQNMAKINSWCHFNWTRCLPA